MLTVAAARGAAVAAARRHGVAHHLPAGVVPASEDVPAAPQVAEVAVVEVQAGVGHADDLAAAVEARFEERAPFPPPRAAGRAVVRLGRALQDPLGPGVVEPRRRREDAHADPTAGWTARPATTEARHSGPTGGVGGDAASAVASRSSRSAAAATGEEGGGGAGANSEIS